MSWAWKGANKPARWRRKLFIVPDTLQRPFPLQGLTCAWPCAGWVRPQLQRGTEHQAGPAVPPQVAAQKGTLGPVKQGWGRELVQSPSWDMAKL